MEMGNKNALNTDLVLRKTDTRGSIDRKIVFFFFLRMIGYQQFVVVVQSLGRV